MMLTDGHTMGPASPPMQKPRVNLFGFLFTLPRMLACMLLTFLLLSSAAIVYTTMQNMSSVRKLATESLDSVALALSLSAGHMLKAGDFLSLEQVRTIFSDRSVAYAFVADPTGKLLFHTNPRLTGSVLPLGAAEELFRYATPTGQRLTLQTGISAYRYTYPVERPNGQELRLRIVLNSLPADRLIAKARQMWWVVGGVLLAFWSMGIFFGWLLMRYLCLQEELARKKHMALIGQMTAVLSHEIRNALGSIKGYTQWVDRKMQPDDALRGPVAMALGGIERVELLVNELLLYSKDEAHRPERINVHRLLAESLLSFQEWQGEIMPLGEGAAWVVADKEKLYRVFVNVIQNALQAMGDSGKLAVSVEGKGRWFEISVADTGPGIRQEDVDLLFTPFHTSKVNGTGIGLAYSKKVIEATGGRIELANRTDMTGAVLTIHLPAGRGEAFKNG
jgi:two-component system, NtrC family, sensor histidine kinase HydH